MGKQGPCCHCGVTSTPLWRNGPPEKPVLCNACGSRWRTKGTLANYTPLHARPESDDFQDHKFSRVKCISIKNNEVKMLKRKQTHDSSAVGGTTPDFNSLGPLKNIDEDTSNRSSSGSAISNNESCAQFGSADTSDLTAPAQSIVWDTMVPSRKRTCVNRPKPSSVEKLTKDLYNILHEQQSSYFSGSSEEDLLFESDAPLVSVEIGHGSVLIRHPNSIAREEESEASSLSVDNKLHAVNEVYSRLTTHPAHNNSKGIKFPSPGVEKIKKPTRLGMEQGQLKRERTQHENLHILGNHDSLLCHMDLKDVINFDEFSSHLTDEEKHQLLKYLPSIDTVGLPDSLKSMFDSPQFKDNLSSFQKLLVDGVFDLSLSNVKTEDCITLKQLALCNLTKSKWVEQYNLLKELEHKKSNGKPAVAGYNAIASGHSLNAKRSRDSQHQNMTGMKMAMNSPKRVKAGYEQKEENDGSCFSPKSLFALPADGSSAMLDSFHFADGSSDQDLLLDVPSNSSFPQAELLLPTASFGVQASTSSSSLYPNPVRR